MPSHSVAPDRFTFKRLHPFDRLILVHAPPIRDVRGEVRNVFSETEFAGALGAICSAESLITVSSRGVMRGLHYQDGMSKLVRCVSGLIADVAVDIRVGSPTFGEYAVVYLSPHENDALFVPDGFAHGIVAVEDHTIALYQMSDVYRPELQGFLRWDDPTIDIEWPLRGELLMSERDAKAPLLSDYLKNPVYRYT